MAGILPAIDRLFALSVCVCYACVVFLAFPYHCRSNKFVFALKRLYQLTIQPFEAADIVCSLSQSERNDGRFCDLVIVGVVVYGRGQDRKKAMMAGKMPAIDYLFTLSLCVCYARFVLMNYPIIAALTSLSSL